MCGQWQVFLKGKSSVCSSLLKRGTEVWKRKLKCDCVWHSHVGLTMIFPIVFDSDWHSAIAAALRCMSSHSGSPGTRMPTPGDEENCCHVDDSSLRRASVTTTLSTPGNDFIPSMLLGSVFRSRFTRNQDPNQSSTKITVSKTFCCCSFLNTLNVLISLGSYSFS